MTNTITQLKSLVANNHATLTGESAELVSKALANGTWYAGIGGIGEYGHNEEDALRRLAETLDGGIDDEQWEEECNG